MLFHIGTIRSTLNGATVPFWRLRRHNGTAALFKCCECILRDPLITVYSAENSQRGRNHSMDLRQKLSKRVSPKPAERVQDQQRPDGYRRETLGKRRRPSNVEHLSQPAAHKGPSPWLNMIIAGLHLHTIVEEKGFLDLMRSLGHDDEILPSAADIYSEMVRLYDLMKKRVIRELAAAENITLACDYWCSKTGQFLVTVTCHFINKSWTQESFVLETRPAPEKSSTDETINQVLKIANTWGIGEKVQVVVTNANNLENAVQKVGWKHLFCFAKTLDQIASQILQHVPFRKVLEVAHIFCFNEEAQKKLREAQITLRLPQATLIPAKGDAWLQTLTMLETISEQQEALIRVLCDMNRLDLLLKGDDRNIIDSAIEALHPFREVAEVMTKDQHCSASSIIPLMEELSRKLNEQENNDMAQLLAKQCSDQFKPADWLTMSTALDPRYKHIVFSNPRTAKEIKGKFLEEMYVKAKAKNPHITEASLVKSNFKRLEDYINMETLPQKGNLLNFWRFNQEKLGFDPEYLSVVTTAVPLDRVFDTQKSQVTSSRRSMLPPELLDMMLFLNGNCWTEEAIQLLVQSLVISWLDYCNSLLAGLPLQAIRSLQVIQNAAARLIFNLPKFTHVTPLLCSLHWLPVAAWIGFKTDAGLQSQDGTHPSRLMAMVKSRSVPRAIQALSTAQLEPPSPRTHGRQASRLFSVVAPRWWNELLLAVRTAESLRVFKHRLKTRLCVKHLSFNEVYIVSSAHLTPDSFSNSWTIRSSSAQRLTLKRLKRGAAPPSLASQPQQQPLTHSVLVLLMPLALLSSFNLESEPASLVEQAGRSTFTS
ncbi:hypothetical protein NFI96_001831 [Prochilodus magdalenae]|nr:hypothetical protein NFI96_001831 [Prochilodus magdalenae]